MREKKPILSVLINICLPFYFASMDVVILFLYVSLMAVFKHYNVPKYRYIYVWANVFSFPDLILNKLKFSADTTRLGLNKSLEAETVVR